MTAPTIPPLTTRIRWHEDGEPGSADVIARPLRDALILSGKNPDDPFTGFGGTTIPLVASVAARNIAVPAPTNGSYAARKDYGGVDFHNGSIWGALTESKRSENPLQKGADPTGVADSYQMFFDTNALGRDVAITNGTYLIGSNLTLSQALRWEQGAKIKIANGANVNITGPIDAGHWQIFDLSLGGTVSFNNNMYEPRYSPIWFGAVGFGISNDQPFLDKMGQSVPVGANIYAPPTANFRLDTTLIFTGRETVSFNGTVDPTAFIDPTKYVRFTWNGVAGGTVFGFDRCKSCKLVGVFIVPNGADIGVDIDGYGLTGLGGVPDTRNAAITSTVRNVTGVTSNGLTFDGPVFADGALASNKVVKVLSSTGAGQQRYISGNTGNTITLFSPWTDTGVAPDNTSTIQIVAPLNWGMSNSNTCERVFFNGDAGRRATFTGVALARFMNTNNEFHKVISCGFLGGYSGAKLINNLYSITAGSFTLNNPAGFNSGPTYVGDEVRIAGAGPGGSVLSAHVTVTGGTSITIDTAASTTVANTFGITGRCYGIGVSINAQNSKGNVIQGCQFSELNYGVYCPTGSVQLIDNNYAGCEVDIYFGTLSDPASEVNGKSEDSRRHVWHNGGGTVTFTACRNAIQNTEPGQGYFTLNNQSNDSFSGCTGEGSTGLALNGAWLFAGDQGHGALKGLTLKGNNWGGVTWARFKTKIQSQFITIENDIGITGTSTAEYSRGGPLTLLADTAADTANDSPLQILRTIGGTSTDHGSGNYGGDVEVTELWGGPVDGDSAGGYVARKYQPRWGKRIILGGDLAGPGDAAIFGGLQIEMPTFGNGASEEARGFNFKSPVMTGGSTLRHIRALTIEDQTPTGVSGATAIEQLGPNDGVVLGGQIVGGTRSVKLAAPTNLSATPIGVTGASTYSYVIVPIDAQGRQGTPSSVFVTNIGNAVLSPSNYNFLKWNRAKGAVKYDILGRGGLMTFSVALGVTDMYYKDVGATALAYTATGTNKTADSYFAGVVTRDGGAVETPVAPVNVLAGSNYIPDAGLIMVHRVIGAGAINFNQPTWYSLTTGIPDGAKLEFEYNNVNAGSITPTFDAVHYRTGTVPGVGTGKRMTWMMRYNSNVDIWYIVGGFSPNL